MPASPENSTTWQPVGLRLLAIEIRRCCTYALRADSLFRSHLYPDRACLEPEKRWRASICGCLPRLGRAPPPSGRGEDEHSLQIPRHGHEAPLAAHFIEPAQRKLTESEHGLDDAEHRL